MMTCHVLQLNLANIIPDLPEIKYFSWFVDLKVYSTSTNLRIQKCLWLVQDVAGKVALSRPEVPPTG
jgi:hypothetical protein